MATGEVSGHPGSRFAGLSPGDVTIAVDGQAGHAATNASEVKVDGHEGHAATNGSEVKVDHHEAVADERAESPESPSLLDRAKAFLKSSSDEENNAEKGDESEKGESEAPPPSLLDIATGRATVEESTDESKPPTSDQDNASKTPTDSNPPKSPELETSM